MTEPRLRGVVAFAVTVTVFMLLLPLVVVTLTRDRDRDRCAEQEVLDREWYRHQADRKLGYAGASVVSASPVYLSSAAVPSSGVTFVTGTLATWTPPPCVRCGRADPSSWASRRVIVWRVDRSVAFVGCTVCLVELLDAVAGVGSAR